MPRTCTVCSNPDREAIDAALVANQSPLRDIARRWRVTKDSLSRHRPHIARHLVKAKQATEAASATTLLEDVRDREGKAEHLWTRAMEILNRASEAQDLRVALQAIRAAADVLREGRSYLELRGQLTGEMKANEEAKWRGAVLIVPPQLPSSSLAPPPAILDANHWREQGFSGPGTRPQLPAPEGQIIEGEFEDLPERGA